MIQCSHATHNLKFYVGDSRCCQDLNEMICFEMCNALAGAYVKTSNISTRLFSNHCDNVKHVFVQYFLANLCESSAHAIL